ncbi:nitronate monooxygenase [Labedaea rhizosphaerae]|uniref:Propionate 3-nitronate monooxygenase n=1 Tax=Labedaea rhizosphaerae TaxID=598644 RepID=A0A4R6S8S1_LABRH|nr:nitronate monooxygenase [Labedaea rhizosphaerae]TDP96292.1 nitroalkane oxidase [Labedaea rhizosphaerae]
MFAQLRVPVIAAPMAGGPSTPELVAAACDAGGFGYLAAGYLTPDAVRAQLAATRELTTQPFGLNLFTPGQRSTVDLSRYQAVVAAEAARYDTTEGRPGWDDDHYAAKLDLAVAERVAAVSFTFGAPLPDDVARLRDAGIHVTVTVTTPAEAARAAATGADALCVQGMSAGGHRGVFEDDPWLPGGGDLFGTLDALRLVAAEVDLPLVAAGGLIRGADVAAVLAAGAVAAQLGTAFLRCPEAGTSKVHRTELAEGARPTALTRAFSGRPARGLLNRFMTEHEQQAPAAYPQLHHLTKPVRAAAAAAGDPEAVSMWAGTTYRQAVEAPVAEVMATLVAEAREALATATKRLA